MTPQGRKAEVVACPTCSTPCERDTYSTYNGDLIGTYKPVPAQSLIDMQARLDAASRLADEWYAGDGYETGIPKIDDATNNRWAAKQECANELRTLLSRDATTTEETK